MAGRKGRRGWGTIRRTNAGRWQCSYVGPDLLRHNAPSTFGPKMDGEMWLAQERRLIERGEWTPPKLRAAVKAQKSITVSDYLSRWIDQRQVKPTTRAGYRNNHRVYIEPSKLGRTPIAALTPEAVRNWYAELDPNKPAARLAVYALVRAAMSTATSDGIFGRNPVDIAGASKVPAPREKVVPTLQQVVKLADDIGSSPQTADLRAYVLISGFCGLRWSEAIELRRKDISDDCAVISINRAATHSGGRCNVGTPKAGQRRTAVIPEYIRADVKHHLDVFVPHDDNALVFAASEYGKRCHLSDDRVRKALKPLLHRHGLDGMVLHSLRHCAGTAAAQHGSLADTMAWLGHSSARASLIYQHSSEERQHRIADQMSRELAQEPDQ